MEAKKIIIAVGLVVLIIVFSFIPFNHKKTVIIKASLYDVAKQINDLNNWKNWNADLKNDSVQISGAFNTDQSALINPAYSYLLHHISAVAFSLIKNNNGKSTASLIEIFPVTDSATNVVWSETITVRELFRRDLITHYSRQTNLDNLKKFMEDVNYKYGFFIQIVPVKDTLILTAETKLSNNHPTNAVADLYRELQSFIIKNKLPAEKKYFYKTILSNDKIAIGIPVYKQTANSNKIKFLQLPGNGRLVEGIYSGNIGGKQAIYTAINNFMLDQRLKQVAQPLEQYNVSDTILNPDSNVNIKIYYPVF